MPSDICIHWNYCSALTERDRQPCLDVLTDSPDMESKHSCICPWPYSTAVCCQVTAQLVRGEPGMYRQLADCTEPCSNGLVLYSEA